MKYEISVHGVWVALTFLLVPLSQLSYSSCVQVHTKDSVCPSINMVLYVRIVYLCNYVCLNPSVYVFMYFVCVGVCTGFGVHLPGDCDLARDDGVLACPDESSAGNVPRALHHPCVAGEVE